MFLLGSMVLFVLAHTLQCRGEIGESEGKWIQVNMALTAYYPDTYSDDESGMMDIEGNRLRTLQEYLDGRAPYVTVSTDPSLSIPYGTAVSIPALDKHFGARIRFQVRDASSQMTDAGFSRLDICVRSEQDSYDLAVNREATVFFDLPPDFSNLNNHV